jgi:carbon storage regulator
MEKMVLIVTRGIGEVLVIGGCTTVTVLNVRGDRIRFRINTPPEVPVCRQEVIRQLSKAAKRALRTVRRPSSK